jgi:four helix bundle protein
MNVSHPKFDLEDRTFRFARNVRDLIELLTESRVMPDDKKQVVRSSGSVAANYLEANESVSGNEFLLRIKICRKEARESHMWLRLMKEDAEPTLHQHFDGLIDEAIQLVKIFNTIAYKIKEMRRIGV